MKLTLIGYGQMGREIEKQALLRGHEIILRIDKDNTSDFETGKFSETDVALEFSTPDTAYRNIEKCISMNIPVVSGTTGWTDSLEEIINLAREKKGTLLYASNFSIGVNILFNLNRRLAGIMDGFDTYSTEMEEIHHIRKKDAPSGTAIKLAEDIIQECKRLDGWLLNRNEENMIRINSVREGDVPGTHRVMWQSDFDRLSLEHEAFSRQGFALGAVFAAEFIYKKAGVFTMSDLLGF